MELSSEFADPNRMTDGVRHSSFPKETAPGCPGALTVSLVSHRHGHQVPAVAVTHTINHSTL